MFGFGLLQGLGVTFKEFVGTYLDDIKRIPSRYAGGREVIDQTQNMPEIDGLFTIQYPEERRKLPERFRNIPVLIYDAETGEDRCTACGICAKVCPPQCIWMVRDRDANGKPITRPTEFYIDASICMNCGLCAEFCPFDAIKMDHKFEITAYQRMPSLVFTLEQLRVPTTYYAEINPTAWAEEEAEHAAKAAAKAEKPAAPRPVAAPTVIAAPLASAPLTAPAAPGAPAPPAAPASAAPAAGGRPTPEGLQRRRAEARARKAAGETTPAPVTPDATDQGAAPTAPPPAAAAGGRPTPEELERRRAEARARKAAGEAQAGAAGEEPASKPDQGQGS